MASPPNCSTCGENVGNDEKALQCDLCDTWEHQRCVRETERLSDELYECITTCSSKSIMYVCTPCRNKGSLSNRVMRLELECARANEQRLASERLLEERRLRVDNLLATQREFIQQKNRLLMQSSDDKELPSSGDVARHVIKTEHVGGADINVTLAHSPIPSLEDASSESEEETGRTPQPIRRRSQQGHPPGFKDIRARVGRYSGKKGEEDFDLWLSDYKEATADFEWNDETRAKWFSWFLEGPAKATWQRTLTAEERASWVSIVKIFQGQYGVHMDPRTAYLRCHELRYEDLGSVQALLESMREYQRMAPEKLSDTNLESILWNKVPYALQREVGEMKDWALQELFQRLLKAEARVQEREWRQQSANQSGSNTNRRNDTRSEEKRSVPPQPGKNSQPESTSKSKTPRDRSNAEMTTKNIRCFNCQEKGHVASVCPKRTTPKNLRLVTGQQEKESSEDISLWTRVLTLKDTVQGPDNKPRDAKTVGPAYKVNITVEGIPTRAFLDHGSQVTIVRRHLLPLIQEKNQWSNEKCKEKNIPLQGQPVGAMGKELGAVGMVILQMEIDETGQNANIPCYVLDSNKPLWKGELKNCAVLLGTNALVEYGFEVFHHNGSPVQPTCKSQPNELNTTLHVVVRKSIHLKPGHTKWVEAMVKTADTDDLVPSQVTKCGMIIPNEEVLATKHCDLPEGLWSGDKDAMIPVTNWGEVPVFITKHSQIGKIEPVDVVSKEDPHWKMELPQIQFPVRLCQLGSDDRNVLLRERLRIGDAVTGGQKEELISVLLQLNEAFALGEEELGETNVVEHSIETKDAPPVSTSSRRIPYALREELEKELENLQRIGCIEKSHSAYASGLVLVRKRGGGLRVCVDYRALNRDTKPDKYPIPRIDELIDRVGKCRAKIFSALDLMKGYHQVKMKEEDKHKTAFICHHGLYQYRRMPFGLTNAPATFQRLIDTLFDSKEWPFVFTYLDDILVASSSIAEHKEHVSRVLKKLADTGLRLTPEKCCFASTEIEYLGHTLTTAGVKPNDAKVTAITEFPQPKDVTSLKRFLGMLNFYRKHIKDLASVAVPLTALTRKDKTTGTTVKFEWSADCDQAFSILKQKLSTAPLLQPPDLAKPFYVWSDASITGFGAVLEQLDNQGQRHPIAYASRQTSAAEKKYAPTELEVAALVFAVESFEVYLLGNPFTIYTDHQALVSAFLVHLKSQTRGLLARWYLRLSKFLPQMKLEYKPGSTNVVADTLSRAPVESEARVLQVQEEIVSSEEETGTTTLQQVQREQKKDVELRKIFDFVTTKSLPDDPREANVVMNMAKKGFYVVDGILYYEGPDMPGHRRIVVPTHLKQKILDEHHDLPFAGHFAVKKLSQRISQYFYWNGLKSDVYKKCSSCVSCASVQGQGDRGRPPLVSIPVGGPFDCIGMDFVELDVSKQGHRYALVFQDYLSKWPEVYALADRKATTVAECLLDLVWKHGVPNKIIHDRAPEFLSEVLQETAELLGISQLPTSGGHPQTDGLVERFNRTLKQALAKMVTKGGRNWDMLLGPVLLAYRATPHTSTGMSPFYLLYGRSPQLPSALDFRVPVQRFPTIETEYGQELVKELKQARTIAKQNIDKKQKEQKKYYDRKVKDVKLKIGDLVMLKTEPRFRLDRSYKGPFQIKSLTSTNAIIQLKDDSEAEELNVSRQRLSLCKPEMTSSTPWVGHSGRLRKRRKVRHKTHAGNVQAPLGSAEAADVSVTGTSRKEDHKLRLSRSGRPIKTPARFFLLKSSKDESQKEGEVVIKQYDVT